MRKIVMAGLILNAVLISGCGIVDFNRAMGEGPEAEAAVQRLDGPNALEQVSLYGKNQKARALALSKINDLGRLRWFVMSGDEPGELRVIAFNRLVALGKANDMFANESGFADVVLTDGNTEHSMGRGKGPHSPCGFPVEWRIKAAQSERINRDSLKKVALDSNMPMELRVAAVQRGCLDAAESAAILDAASAGGDNEKLAFTLLPKVHENELLDLMSGRRCNATLNARKLAFKYLLSVPDFRKFNDRGNSVLSEAIEHALWGVKDEDKKDDNVKFVKHVICETKDAKTLCRVVTADWNQKIEYEEYLALAASQIKDDVMLVEILKHARYSSIKKAALAMLQDEKLKKKWGDIIEAKYADDPKMRGAALARVYAADPKEAYSLLWGWSSDVVETDLKTLSGLLKLCKKDDTNSDYPRKKILPRIKKGLMAYTIRQVESMSSDKLGQLVKVQADKAKKLASESKTCVIADRYVGMTGIAFVALNKVVDVKSVPIDWDVDEGTGRVVMREIAFDSKNLYKATGVEKSKALFSLPSKLGLAPFEVGVTKLQYNKNEIAEYFGDFSSSFSGGDVYYRSETQGKGVTALFWKESGQLILTAIE